MQEAWLWRHWRSSILVREWAATRIAIEVWLSLELWLRLETSLLRHHAVLVLIESRLLWQHETSWLRLHRILSILLLQPLLLTELTQTLTWGCLQGGSTRHTSQLWLERRSTELTLLLEVLWGRHRSGRRRKQCRPSVADWRLWSLSRWVELVSIRETSLLLTDLREERRVGTSRLLLLLLLSWRLRRELWRLHHLLTLNRCRLWCRLGLRSGHSGH